MAGVRAIISHISVVTWGQAHHHHIHGLCRNYRLKGNNSINSLQDKYLPNIVHK